ncbi:MAG: hypothetical protein WC655_25420, partial [Candidatus Hydrogenedentales bacterium]
MVSHRVGVCRLTAGVCVLFLIAATTAFGAGKPAKLKSTPQGEPLHYYNGDMRVDVVLSLDEFVVAPPATKGVAPLAIKALIPSATTRSAGAPGDLHVKLAAPANNRAALEQQAKTLADAGYTVEPVLFDSSVRTPSDENRQTLTNQFSLKLKPGATIEQVSSTYGVSVVSEISFSPDTYIVQTTGKGLLGSLETANALYESGLVVFATPLIERKMSKRLVPND